MNHEGSKLGREHQARTLDTGHIGEHMQAATSITGLEIAGLKDTEGLKDTGHMREQMRGRE